MIQDTAPILIVDDDPFFANYAADVLTDRGGYEVHKAHSVAEALDVIKTISFRLVIMDLKMPPGEHFSNLNTAGGQKTGIVLAREIKRVLPNAAFIIQT